MSLLSIVKSVALRVGVTVPTVAITSLDTNIQQIIGFVNEDAQELAARHSWQELTNESTFNTLATEVQGTLLALTGSDFAFIVNETMWNRTQRRPVFGPKAPAEWQQLKAQFMQGPWIQYRIRGGNILFMPVPAAGNAIYFEWVSKNWATDQNGANPAANMLADTDLSKLDERLLTLGGVWRYKQAKKLAYDEDFNKAEAAISDSIGRNASKARLNLAGQQTDIYPGIVVPAGNWNGVVN